MLIIALILFTAIRTLHFLQMTFPPELGYVAYLGLAAFDVGILGWLYYASHSAEGDSQRALAYGMIFVCMGGVIITTIADMIIVSAQNGLTKLPPQWSTIGLWGVIIVIIMNVIAGILVHLNAPSHKRHFAMESARDKIHTTVLSHIQAQADVIAPQIAEHTARHWANQVIHEMTGSIPGAYTAPQLPASKVIDADKSDIVYTNTEAASRTQTIDPHGVQEKIDSKKKSLENHSLKDRVGSLFGKPVNTPEVPRQTGNVTQVITDDRPVTEDDNIVEPDYGEIENGPSTDDPSTWNLVDWRQYRNEVDAWTFDQVWQEEHGDIPFPDDRPIPTKKKRNGGKQTKNVTRRQLLTGNQGD
jgi:hypothetical protein